METGFRIRSCGARSVSRADFPRALWASFTLAVAWRPEHELKPPSTPDGVSVRRQPMEDMKAMAGSRDAVWTRIRDACASVSPSCSWLSRFLEPKREDRNVRYSPR